MRAAADLLAELRALDESHTIEAKRARRVDRGVLETVCAFANEPDLGGGYLLLGVAADEAPAGGHSYRVVGVPDPDRAQSDLASQCASAFNRPVRPTIAVEQVEGHRVLVVWVPEAEPADKPVYLRALRLPRGAFRRIGSTDQEGTDDDLAALYQARKATPFDQSLLEGATRADLDPEALRQYRRLRADVNPHADELAWSDDDLLLALGAAQRDARGALQPTVAGGLLFGTPMTLRRSFPMTRIDYIRVPGRRWVEDPDHRFDTVEIRAPLIVAARRAINAVLDDLPKAFHLPEGALVRQDRALLPARVVREAVVNAVMHRSYRAHAPIQILRYANRIEVRNPGRSLKPLAQLGEPGSKARNPRLAAVMHDLNLAESKGSGIRTMRTLMVDRDLAPPTFQSNRRADEFVATLLFHHFLTPPDLDWLGSLTPEPLSGDEARALVFVREVGAMDNATYRALNRVETLVASAALRRLRDLGLLVMKGKGSATYYLPGPNFRGKPAAQGPQLTAQGPQLDAQGPQLGADRAQADPRFSSDRPQLAVDRPQLDPARHQLAADRHQLAADRPQLAADRTQPIADHHESALDPHQSSADPHQSNADPHQLSADPHQLSADLHQQGADLHQPIRLDELPGDLRAAIESAGKRPRRATLHGLIRQLCGWRPLPAKTLAQLLGDRDDRVLVREHLTPMLAAGELAYTIPDMPNHPRQAYTLPTPEAPA